jgi:excisionase family DNA binding protein
LVEELLKLADAARELGCHVETLRERVREGRLPAVQGSRGAYLVSRTDLAALPGLHRGRPRKPFRRMTLLHEQASWELIEEFLERQSPESLPERVMARRFAEKGPQGYPHLYNLMSVQRLRLLKLPFAQIALELGISERHARRLAAKSLWLHLRYAVLMHMKRADRIRARVLAQDYIDRLRRQLEKEGIRRHSKALNRRELTWYEIQGLRDAGLYEDEVKAITLLGLSEDELNALLLRGLEASSHQGGQRIRIAD